MTIARQSLIFFLALGLSFLFAFSAHADTYVVTKTADTADGTCDADCSLREAVIASNANSGTDTITLPAGTYLLDKTGTGEDVAATGDLDVTEGTTTITGAGAATTIIDGNTTDRIFHATGGSITVSDVTLQNGNNTVNEGGAVYVEDADTFSATDAIIQNNTANGSGGGAFYTYAGTISITDSVVSGNTAVNDNGGAVYSDDASTITITNSRFSNNTAELNDGGALYVNGGATITIVASSFIQNTAERDGGAIFVDGSSGGDVDLVVSTLSGNTAFRHGGGIAGTEIDITHSTIAFNTADGNDNGTGEGGGIYENDTGISKEIDIVGSIVANNTDSGGESPDCAAAASDDIISGGYTLIADTTGCTAGLDDAVTDILDSDPLLDSERGLNGGETLNHALGALSPAKDAVPEVSCLDQTGSALTIDQRGMTRPENSNCDIGAYELDQTAPVVSVTAGTDTIECGVDTFTDAGATATDNFDSSISATTTDTIDTDTAGSQTITYTATDNDNNSDTDTRTVTVQDTTVPVITLNGEESVKIALGDTYTDDGATVADVCDSTVTVSTTNPVDTDVAGTYTVTYSSTDASSNEAVDVTRTVVVAEAIDGGDSSTSEVTKITPKKKNKVLVNYKDGTSETFTIFTKGSAKPKVKLSTNGERIVAINANGTKVRVLNAFTGAIVSKKKLANKKQVSPKLKVLNYYSDAKDEVLVISKKSGKLRLTMFRLTKKSKLTKKKLRITNPYTKKKFTIKRKKKQVQIKRGKKVVAKYKVTKKGGLKKL